MKKLINYLSVAALLLLCACGGATYITPSSDSVNFPIEGGEETVNIDADGSWEITSCPDWVTTEVQEGGLVIKVGPNETGSILDDYVEIRGKEGVEINIKVTQATKCTHITPSEETVEFEKEGGTKTVNIDTDGSLQVEAPEGFTASFADGVLTVNAGVNDGGKRSGDIKLTADEQSATVAVSQKGNVCPRCNGTGKVTCSKCGGKGYYRYYFDPDYYDLNGCKKCGGRGASGEGVDNMVKGSGRMTCPDCGGSGQ